MPQCASSRAWTSHLLSPPALVPYELCQLCHVTAEFWPVWFSKIVAQQTNSSLQEPSICLSLFFPIWRDEGIREQTRTFPIIITNYQDKRSKIFQCCPSASCVNYYPDLRPSASTRGVNWRCACFTVDVLRMPGGGEVSDSTSEDHSISSYTSESLDDNGKLLTQPNLGVKRCVSST